LALERLIPSDAGAPTGPDEFLMSRQMREAMDTIAHSVGGLGLDRQALSGLVALVYFPEHSPAQHAVSVFDTRSSKKELVGEFEDWVSWIIEERARHGLKQARPASRLRKSECMQYLEVFDLRAAGKTSREIAQHLWPGARGDIEQRAKSYYRKAQALVAVPPL